VADDPLGARTTLPRTPFLGSTRGFEWLLE
jgi:hypothetical protein